VPKHYYQGRRGNSSGKWSRIGREPAGLQRYSGISDLQKHILGIKTHCIIIFENKCINSHIQPSFTPAAVSPDPRSYNILQGKKTALAGEKEAVGALEPCRTPPLFLSW